MKDFNFLSNPAKTQVFPRPVCVSLASRCRVLPILLLCLAFSTSVWGADQTASKTIAQIASANSWTNGTQYTSCSLDSKISASVSGSSNTGKYYTADNSWRLYANENGSLTISAATGSTLESVTITYTVKDNGTLSSGGSSVSSGSAVSASGNSISFDAGSSSGNKGKVFITAISVTYDDGEGGSKCATPTFSPVAGTYCGSQTVTISSTTTGSTIYYTTDGSTPTTSSAHGTAGAASATVTVNSSKTVKAIAVKDGQTDSSTGSAAYTITSPLSTMDEIYSAATSAGSTATAVCIEFDNWVVSGVATNGKNVYVTDGTKGFMIYNNSAGMGFSVGDVLSGSAGCKVQLYNGAAELTELSSTTDGLSITTGGTAAPIVMTASEISALTGVNTGCVVMTTGVCTYSSSKYYINGAQLYNQLYNYTTPTTGTTYTVTGVYLQYNSTQEILPLSDLSTGPLTPVTVTFNAGTGTCGTSSLTEASAGSGVTLPAATHACEGWSLAGWSTSPCSETTIEPSIYVAGTTYKPAVDITLYAVYKKTETSGGTPKQYTLTITGADAPTSYGYEMSDIDAEASDASTYTVSFGTTDVMKNGANIQFKKNSGDLYNSNDLGTINSVSITQEGSSLDYVIGDSEDPMSNAAGGYFSVYNTSSNAAYASQIVVVFTKTNSTTTTTYNSNPICGPFIHASEVERLTSTQGQTVKSQAITVRGGSLTGGTLSVKSITGDAAHFACALASQTITAGAIETTYTISYAPTVSGATHTAEIIFWDGTTQSEPITLRGRSLPAQFAIVAYDGVNYYALDGSMSGTAKQATPLPVEVSANTVVSCPTRAIYSLTQRETPDANVYLVGPAGRLWGSSSSSDLNTKSLTSTSQTGWLLSTSDFDTYHITNADVTDRGLMLNTSSNYLGHYKTNQYGKANYYGDLYILPFSSTCTSLNPPTSVSVIPKATTATITWAEVTDAISYDVTCSAGSVTVDVPNRKATITGLTKNSSYTFTVKAVATGTDCSVPYNGHFTTSNCDDVPYGVRITPAATSATFKWSMESASATIRIYSDEECNTKVGEDHTGLTSPATITGLTENTQYYAKILAGGTCEGAVINFRTNSPSVEIAEWFPDSIRIIIDANADASVTIEDKHEHGSSTTNYADSLFFSKYFEADSENKLLALYNGTQDTIKLSNYCLKRSQRDASTYPTPNELTMELGSLGRVKPGYIVPNEELIIIRYANSESNSAEECASTQPGYENWYVYPSSSSEATFLNFSGPMSIGLYSKTAGKFIDVIGATTNSTGTGTLCQIDASNKKTCNAAQKSFNDMPGFYTLSGDNQQTPVVETNYGLSTNRCLIIRKNTVKSGVNAVTSNVYSTWQECSAEIAESFVTLSTEWAGLQVGPGTSSGETHSNTCIGMGYVGGFDYSGYYTTYDSIGGIKDLTGKQNDDGTYTIKIIDLDTLACTTMRIKVYEGGEEKVSREYQVPIMVDTDKEWLTTDTIFINDNPNQLRTYNTCKECDVVILKGATLTKAAHAGNDVDSIRNLTIYPGGTMKIPTSRTFNVGSVQFRVEGEDVPFIKLAGTLKSADEQVLVSRRIDNSDAYFFSLPYDCNISDIRWSNGEPAVLDDGFRIKEYDSRARADEGSTKGTPGHWKMVTGSKLEAGKGYQISVNSRFLRELIFPLEINTTNVSDAENEKAPHGDNIVPIHQYENGATTINNHNWNFIAQPYLCAMSPMAGDAITYGYLEYEIEEVAGEQQVVWYRRMEGNQYLTIYNPSTRTYDQKFWNSVTQLDPFLAFFVQGKTEGGSFTFTEGNRLNNAPARHLASQAEVDDDPSIFVGVTLSGNGLTDQANLRVRQDFTEDEYKLGYDLLKFTTYYKDRPQVYMKTPSYQLAFQAVNDSVAKNTFLPMGVYCYKPGTYTFGLSNDYPIDEVEAVYLYDKVAGVTTNLLYDTYTITTSSQLYTNTRFALNVIVNRRAPQVTTDIGIPEAPDDMVRKILINGHVYIQRGAAIYDITGKQMLNF